MLTASRRQLSEVPKKGDSIGSDLVNGLKGLFTLPPNFRKYSKFISYGWGGFAVVAIAVYSTTWVADRLPASERREVAPGQEPGSGKELPSTAKS